MISDKERSEVAKAFRSVAKVIKRQEVSGMPDLFAAWMAISTAIKGRITFCDTSDVFDALADLIDRPTCSMSDIGDDTEQIYRCSACGDEYFMSDFTEFPWRFCPNCGADVIE